MTGELAKSQIFKVMLMGDVGTGKTTFLTQLIHRTPERLPKPTSHLSVFTMRMSKPATIVQVWDSPGDPNTIPKCNAVLVFVDLTNQYTFERARHIVDQIAMQASGKVTDVHVVASKIEAVQKDSLKMKVTNQMLRSLASKFKGGVFRYSQHQNIQQTIQDVVQWRAKREELLKEQLQKQKDVLPSPVQIKFEKEAENVNCECRIS